MGRPSLINQVVRTRDDGTPVTYADAIIERLTLGLTLTDACTNVGISRTVVHNWKARGHTARAHQTEGHDTPPSEAPYLAFVNAIEKAVTERELNALAAIQTAARGSLIRTVTSKFDSDGNLIERTEVERTAREWTAAAWLLERTMPHRYARRTEVTGAGGAPLIPEQDSAASIAEQARLYLQGVADAASDEAAAAGSNGA